MNTDSARQQPPIADPLRMVIAGRDLAEVIKVMAEYWERLREISETRDLADDHDFAPWPGDPTFAELYEAQVADLAAEIGEIRIAGDT